MESTCAINERVITGAQIRAARALLKWSAQDLAEKAKLSWATLQRMESTDDVPSSNVLNLMRIKSTLESAGVEFINSDSGGGPGVRWRS